MAHVKVFLEPQETELDADLALQKAFELHSSGEIHSEDEFRDPAMNHVFQRLEEIHDSNYQAMLREIFEALESEYADGY